MLRHRKTSDHEVYFIEPLKDPNYREDKIGMRGLNMSGLPPDVITLKAESSIHVEYDNHLIASTNDHVVRIATMTEPYHWHFHPNSDETFLVIEGQLAIEFEEGSLELHPGQLLTVPRGVRHRTRPVGGRSVNLTFEMTETETVVV
jgi:mannose-6-phosphate isomerase-like protein (cupin superfamily)